MASRCATPCRTTSKHNEANLENNRDGHSNNHSWNCGVEGPTDDVHVIALRRRQVRNMLTTLFFSQGVPMLLAGDELYRTQNGNNNAYCQDNEISWVNWDGLKADDSLLQFVRGARRRCAARARSCGATPSSRARCRPVTRATSAGGIPAGHEMADQEWNNPDLRCLGVGLGGTASSPDLHAVAESHRSGVRIPAARQCRRRGWDVVLDTAHPVGVLSGFQLPAGPVKVGPYQTLALQRVL